MNKYGAKPVTAWTEKGEIRFRSTFEYRWYIWCQLRKDQGLIKDWWYERLDMALDFPHGRKGNIRTYLPDFTILTNDDEIEIEETKGCFKGLDYTKIKKYAELKNPNITLIFTALTNCKSLRDQYLRAERIEPHITRVIYDANKTILTPIKHLFDY